MAKKEEAADRLKIMTDEEALTQLIKLHIKEEPQKTQLAWKGCNDMSVVVALYVGFLTAVALTGQRLSKKLVLKCLKKVWSSPQSILNDFADKLCEAERHCRYKKKQVRSGCKTHDAVLQVIKAYGGQVGCSLSPSVSPSPEAEDDDCVIVEEDDDPVAAAWRAAALDNLRARDAELANLKSLFGPPTSRGAASSSQAMPQPESPTLVADSPLREAGSPVAAKVPCLSQTLSPRSF